MKGDFTRDTFDPSKRFARVLMQQGRVQLDADFNEQAAILLHYMQTLAKDLIGEHGGSGDAFEIKADPQKKLDFSISPGHYYVDGILCEIPPGDVVTYKDQADYPLPDEEELENDNNSYLVYLDVWERHITAVEDDGIREVALGGPDTATRTKVVWQVKALRVTQSEIDNVVTLTDPTNTPERLLEKKLEALGKLKKGKLSARVPPTKEADDQCIIPPDSLYRGGENQLYRVEIHNPSSTNGSGATFKWSRNNGSDVFPITKLQDGDTAFVEHLGRDPSRSLEPDNWVEVVDDHCVKQGKPGPLLQVDRIDKAENAVTLRSNANANYDEDQAKQKHALLRRWDSADDIDVKFGKPGDPNEGWIPLEDGIEVRFEEGDSSEAIDFQTGDYWLIPARTATGKIQWPQGENTAAPPRGIKHHYAPLGHIHLDGDGKVVEPELKDDYRRVFEPISKRI